MMQPAIPAASACPEGNESPSAVSSGLVHTGRGRSNNALSTGLRNGTGSEIASIVNARHHVPRHHWHNAASVPSATVVFTPVRRDSPFQQSTQPTLLHR